jgi:1,4-dihydroxy-2-naphthoate octaprenyltransferase
LIWLAAARPRTLPAAIAPVLVGTAAAAPHAAVVPALAALFGALAIQIGANFANDAFDGERGVDGADRLGPRRAVGAGLVTAAAMKRAALAAFAIAALPGLYLTIRAGWAIPAIGVASILAAVAYTGGPRLGYRGLGDVFVFAFFGLVAVCGTTYVQTGAVPVVSVLAAIPVGALTTAILVVNNLRDRAGDARAGKRTLAVRFGRRAAIVEYAALVLVAHGASVGLAIWTRSPAPLLGLVTLPLGAARVRAIARTDGAALNAELGATAQLLLLHAVALSAGLWISAR